MEGWIKLHRSIESHWIIKDASKLKAWILMLINVNHSNNKVLIKGELFECDRGESLRSYESWAELFGNGWDKSKVRRFFNLLQTDNMIVIKNELKTTRLTICNYDTYQSERNANETQMKRKRNADETQTTPNKNEKNVNNEKNENKIKDSLMSEIRISDVPDSDKKYFEIAEGFRKLFIKNLKQLDINNTSLEKAKYKNYVNPIRLMITQDKRSFDELREIFIHLQSDDFWRKNILSTDKLRKQFEKLLIASRSKPKVYDKNY